MSSSQGFGDGGLPRGPRRPLRPKRSFDEAGGPAANEAKRTKLQRTKLERLARQRGLQLRHSTYGYALIDASRNQIDGRNDMTLDEVETRLAPD